MDVGAYAFGEDLGELKETTKYLKHRAGSLFNLSKSFRREYKNRIRKLPKRRRRPIDRAKQHADLWLEYRFAASPLVRSMLDAFEAYAHKPKHRPKYERARGIGGDTGTSRFDQSVSAGSGEVTYRVTQDTTAESNAVVLYKVTNPLYSWQFHLGLRGKDIPETLWQLFPYSFMVDRVVDISSTIRAATNILDPSLVILAASNTVRLETKDTVQYIAQTSSDWTYSVSGNVREVNNFSYTRRRWHPSLLDAVPTFDKGGLWEDVTSIVDLLALSLANFSPTKR